MSTMFFAIALVVFAVAIAAVRYVSRSRHAYPSMPVEATRVRVTAARDTLPPGSFDQALPDALNAGAALGLAMSLLLIDIDDRSAPSKTSKVERIDNAMRWLLRRVLANARVAEDTVARYGPSGYALVLQGADAQFANTVAERLRKEVEIEGASSGDGLVAAITVSIGASTWYPAQQHDAVGLTAAADFALFASRRAGGNRVSAVAFPIDIDHTMKMSSAVQIAHAVR